MPPVTSDRVPALSPGHLARLFGVDDLPARLAAVDDCIDASLRADGALRGEAAAGGAGAGRRGGPPAGGPGAWGKSLRPLFTIVAAELGGTFDERVVKAAAAVE